jgi:hypothetical protein
MYISTFALYKLRNECEVHEIIHVMRTVSGYFTPSVATVPLTAHLIVMPYDRVPTPTPFIYAREGK